MRCLMFLATNACRRQCTQSLPNYDVTSKGTTNTYIQQYTLEWRRQARSSKHSAHARIFFFGDTNVWPAAPRRVHVCAPSSSQRYRTRGKNHAALASLRCGVVVLAISGIMGPYPQCTVLDYCCMLCCCCLLKHCCSRAICTSIPLATFQAAQSHTLRTATPTKRTFWTVHTARFGWAYPACVAASRASFSSPS